MGVGRPVCVVAASSSVCSWRLHLPSSPTRASSSDTTSSSSCFPGLPAGPGSPQPQHTALPLSAAALPGGRAPSFQLGRGWRWGSAVARQCSQGWPSAEHQGLLPPDLVCTGGLGGRREGWKTVPQPARHLRMSPSHRVSPLGSAPLPHFPIVRQSPPSLLPCPPTLPTEP